MKIDWRVALGLTLTAIWFTAGFVYLLVVLGWGGFVHLPTADIGSFLEGAFAPLAFLWLVIGHFMQQKEITANTRAMMMQEQSARRMELHSRRDSYFKLLTLVQDQLGVIAAFHYFSVCGPSGTGEMSAEEFTEQRTQASNGDNALFVRKMISLAVQNREDPEKLHDIFFGTEIRQRHTENYRNTFRKLLQAAQEVDTDDMLSSALLSGSAQGLLYTLIERIAAGEELTLTTGTVSPSPLPADKPATLAG